MDAELQDAVAAGGEAADDAVPPQLASPTVGAGAAQAVSDPPPQAPELRESQVQSAVAFLAHPKVRGSSAESKRAFLVQKGLTEAEIAEAVRRVPDAPAPSSGPVLGPGMTPSVPPQKPYPTPTVEALQPLRPHLEQGQQLAGPQPIRWTQVVVGVGAVAATTFVIQRYLVPQLGAWWQTWRAGTSAEEARRAQAEADQQRTAQLVAAAIQAQTAELRASVEGLKDMLRAVEKGKAAAPSGGAALGLAELRAELRAFAASLVDLSKPAASAAESQAELRGEIRAALGELRALTTSAGAITAASSAAASARAPAAAASLSPGTHSANGPLYTAAPALPVSFAQPARSAPNPPLQFGAGLPPGVAASPASANGGAGFSSPPGPPFEESPPAGRAPWFGPSSPELAPEDDSPLAQPPHPASYMEVLEMLEKGQTPPGIRTDIADTPPDPAAPPPPPKLAQRAKPWERAAAPDPAPGLANGHAAPAAHRPQPTPPGERLPSGGSGASFPPASRAFAGAPSPPQPDADAAAGVTITELEPSPPPGTWKPPGIPARSMPLPQPEAGVAAEA